MTIRYFYLLALILLTGFISCKKSVDYPHLVQNRITEYKVVNLQDTLIYGTVDNTENTITVYVPYYYAMSVIQPQIAVDATATLMTAERPVDINDQTQTYSVKGIDGSIRTYKLAIVQQNTPDLTLNWFDGLPMTEPGSFIPDIVGNFLSTSTATLKVKLVEQITKKELVPDLSTAQIGTDGYQFGDAYFFNSRIPADADSGHYDVQIDFLGHSVKLAKPLQVYYNVPDIGPSWDTRTVAQGGTTTFLANNYFINLSSVTAVINGKTFNLPVKSYDRKQAVITIPTEVPTGDWGTVQFSFQFGKWAPVITAAHLIVTKL
ncbi:hypothetical protein ACCC92_23965 [Mucilaginibacter sp. Mucisp84]|uniref:hypothetical protein n=1 Tax=Mucilaginibacter sp. Mucisp84 TaxID=3243058 RepID=UPI0039A67FA1